MRTVNYSAEIYLDGQSISKQDGNIELTISDLDEIQNVSSAADSDGNALTVTDETIFEIIDDNFKDLRPNPRIIRRDGSRSTPPI